MPIHDQSYRRYGGGRATPGRAWTVIARAGIATLVRKRIFLGLLLASWLPFVVWSVQIYVYTVYPQTGALLQVDAATFRRFLDFQSFPIFIVTVYVGAGLIANDRRANALQIYLSKPLMRTEYIFGKAAVLFAFLALVTGVPALLLLLMQVIFSGSLGFLRANLFLIPAISVAALLQVSVASFTMLALSSLSKSPRYVAILYVGIVFFTRAIFTAMYGITGSSSMSWLSPGASLEQIIDLVFRMRPRHDTPWQVSLLVLIGLIAVSISVLERRVRGVEVVT